MITIGVILLLIGGGVVGYGRGIHYDLIAGFNAGLNGAGFDCLTTIMLVGTIVSLVGLSLLVIGLELKNRGDLHKNNLIKR